MIAEWSLKYGSLKHGKAWDPGLDVVFLQQGQDGYTRIPIEGDLNVAVVPKHENVVWKDRSLLLAFAEMG